LDPLYNTTRTRIMPDSHPFLIKNITRTKTLFDRLPNYIADLHGHWVCGIYDELSLFVYKSVMKARNCGKSVFVLCFNDVSVIKSYQKKTLKITTCCYFYSTCILCDLNPKIPSKYENNAKCVHWDVTMANAALLPMQNDRHISKNSVRHVNCRFDVKKQ